MLITIVKMAVMDIRSLVFASISYVLLYTIVLATFCLDSSHFHGLDDQNDKTLGQKFFNRFYLASCTVTTLSFGDIYPKTTVSKSLVTVFSFISAMALASQIIGAVKIQ